MLANAHGAPPNLPPQSSEAGVDPSQPSSNQTVPMRQRLGEDLFRLVQVRTESSKGKPLSHPTLMCFLFSFITAYQLHEPDGGFGSFVF